MKLSHALKTIPLVALAVVLLMPAARAGASASQVTLMQDDTQLLFTSDERRIKTLDEMKALGADVVKFRLDWASVAPSPNSKQKPKGFTGDDPADYNAAVWGVYDRTVSAIIDRGMKPYILLGGRAPHWASGKTRVTRPKANEFRNFVQAVGTRYSGTYSKDPVNPLAGKLPRVVIYSAWNEVNLKFWLAPQYSHGKPVSPRIYRDLVRAAHQGLVNSGHGGDDLFLGELLPFARSGEAGHEKVRPIEFLRELACVDSKYRPYKGNAAKERGCSGFKKLPGTGIAYHPYTLPGGPDVATPNKDDASVGELDRVVHALDKLGRAHRIAKGLPIWGTEFGYQTDPPDRFQTPIKKVPGFLGEAEWYSYRNPRVASFAQYPLVDDKLTNGGDGFQSGLRTHDRKKKKGVYEAFQRPLYVDLKTSKVVEVFGGLRTASEGQKVKIESKLHKSRWKKLGTATLGPQGYFDRVFQVSKATDRRYRFRLGKVKSRAATAHRRR
jgi:hypothetical protein